MTFEEFFIKKKIDLKALKAADEPLFEEFKAHYSAMGEKSFDHSKKFWFNKLRKSFHLAEEETVIAKPVEKQVTPDTASETSRIPTAKPAGFKPRFKAPSTTVVDEAQATSKQEIADSAESTPDSIPTGFKPRFKAGVTKAPDAAASTPASEETTDEATTSSPKPTGFKPRFKAGVTKAPDAAASSPASEETTDEATTSAPKLTGFKPRFKAGVTKAPDTAASTPSSEETTDEATTSAPKPTGFKPRFKAGVTKAETAEQTQLPDTKAEVSPDASVKTETENNSPETQEPAASKPMGFKPRFKAGITKTAAAEQTQLPDTKAEVSPDTSVKAEPENNSTETQEPAASKPTGFKPRFKAGVTKTETAEQTQLPDTKDEIKLDASVKAEPENDSIETQEPAASKPTGFKPRFKAGITKIDKKEE
ncbi:MULTISPECIES: hypothetical protein [Sphingobacterium]|nr:MULTISPECIES: hypothetical protein [Sphingobacterium]